MVGLGAGVGVSFGRWQRNTSRPNMATKVNGVEAFRHYTAEIPEAKWSHVKWEDV